MESKKNLNELFVADSMTVIFILELNSVKKCKHFTVKSFYLEHWIYTGLFLTGYFKLRLVTIKTGHRLTSLKDHHGRAQKCS